MAAKQELAREGTFFLVRNDKLPGLDYYNNKCLPLFGSEARFDPDGYIHFPTWHFHKATDLADYTVLSRLHPSTRIGASGSRYQNCKEKRINKVRTNGGSVEAAIQTISHILEYEIKRELPQMEKAKIRIDELKAFFSPPSFQEITDEQLREEERETTELLEQIGLNPQIVILREKQRIAGWMVEASGGRDSLQRRNPLITRQALTAARRRAVLRENVIKNFTIDKFILMREALLFERAFCREIYAEAAERLRIMPMTTVFSRSDNPSTYNLNMTLGQLDHIIFLLKQPHVRPYRTASRKTVTPILEKVGESLEKNRQASVDDNALLAKAREMLLKVLEKFEDINYSSKS